MSRSVRSFGRSLVVAAPLAFAFVTVAPTAHAFGFGGELDLAKPAPVAAAPAPDAVDEATKPVLTGFELAATTGLSFPGGSLSENNPQGDHFGVQVPLELNVGYRFTPHFYFGTNVGFSLGQASLERQGKTEGSSSFRAGLRAAWHFRPDANMDPWVGWGIGFESTSLSKGDLQGRLYGFDFAKLSGGLDFRVDRRVTVGPYVQYSMGMYTTMSDESAKGRSSGIDHPATHSWATAGVRVAFMP